MAVFMKKDGVLRPLGSSRNMGTGGGSTIKKLTQTNPALTPTSGKCTWTITNTLNISTALVQVSNVATGKVVVVDIQISASNIIIGINSTVNIAAGTYQMVAIG